MNKLKWLLTALALIFVVILTMPPSGYVNCDHQYAFSDNCHTSVCTKCSETRHYELPQHVFVNSGCTSRSCQHCGFAETGEFHTVSRIPCSDKTLCTVCGVTGTYPAGEYHPNQETHYSEGCLSTVSCADCRKKLRTLTNHTWVSTNCSKEVHCADCGQDYQSLFGFSPTHLHEHSFFDFFTFCTRCHRFLEFRQPSVQSVGALIGLLMCIAALVYVIVNRKRITVQGGLFIRTAVPDAHAKESEIDKHFF